MTGGSVASTNALLMDDTPAKLLTYELMLDGLAEGVLKATSVDEALQILLKTDVALILTDVSARTGAWKICSRGQKHRGSGCPTC